MSWDKEDLIVGLLLAVLLFGLAETVIMFAFPPAQPSAAHTTDDGWKW